jgi:hypothetical protein
MTDTNYYRNQLKTDMGNSALNEAMSCVLLFDQKQQDYGSKNIASFEDKDMNMLGTCIRLNDKVQRMMNLLTKRIKEDGEPNNESIKDNARDISNYGLILSLLEQDQWK